MGRDTKPNFNSNKFEQCTTDIMNLSGCTQIYGKFDIESGSTLTICDNVGAGKVLTSNASGIATWQELTGGTVTASNGLTKVEDDIQLGGTLGGATTVTAGNNEFKFVGKDADTCFGIDNIGGYGSRICGKTTDSNFSSSIKIQSSSNGSYSNASLEATCTTNNTSGKVCTSPSITSISHYQTGGTQALYLNRIQGASFIDSFCNRGIVYADDYRANFVDHSLVTKQYVDGVTSGSTTGGTVTASNGLTKVDEDVQLGGTLIGNTTIETTGLDFILGKTNSICAAYNNDVNNQGILLGCNNCVDSYYGSNNTVFGGKLNVNSSYCGDDNVIIGGRCNTIDSYYSNQSMIVGGNVNKILGQYNNQSIIVGGKRNEIKGDYAFYGALLGGQYNVICATQYSYNNVILGGQENVFCESNSHSVILGGQSIIVSASTLPEHAIVPNLAIWNTPSTGDGSDLTLVWDSVDKKVKTVVQGGGSAAASNGLSVDGDNIVLGGLLTGNTEIIIPTGNTSFTIGDQNNCQISINGRAIKISLDNQFVNVDEKIVSVTSCNTGIRVCGGNNSIQIINSGASVTFTGNSFQYDGDYEAGFVDRSFVTKQYVDTSFNTVTGITASGYVSYSGASKAVDLGSQDLTTTGAINGGTLTIDELEVNGDAGINGDGCGIVLCSPDGTAYCITVANGGTLSVSAV